MTATTNTGPLIALAKLYHLHLLPALYGLPIVPQAVYDECVIEGQTRGYADADVIQAFLKQAGVLPVAPQALPPEIAGDVHLGQGEIEAIALAKEHQSLLLIDEVYARALAEQRGCKQSARWAFSWRHTDEEICPPTCWRSC